MPSASVSTIVSVKPGDRNGRRIVWRSSVIAITYAERMLLRAATCVPSNGSLATICLVWLARSQALTGASSSRIAP
jgi:hypothetical protein